MLNIVHFKRIFTSHVQKEMIINTAQCDSPIYLKCKMWRALSFFFIYQHFTTTDAMRLYGNAKTYITQEIASSDWASCPAIQPLRWNLCFCISVWFWKTAFPPSTSPHHGFMSVSNSNLLLACGHFNNLLCNRVNYSRSEKKDWGYLNVLNLY